VIVPSRPRRGGTALFWGQVRPGDAHTVEIEFRRGRRGAYRALRQVATEAHGYFITRLPAVPGYYRYRYDGGASGRTPPQRLQTR
jgi:hypothetical protein